jgi:hypothetical protein
MVLQPFVGPWPFLHFCNLYYTDGWTPWTSDQPVARPLPTPRTTQTQNKRTHRYPWDGVRTHDHSIWAGEEYYTCRTFISEHKLKVEPEKLLILFYTHYKGRACYVKPRWGYKATRSILIFNLCNEIYTKVYLFLSKIIARDVLFLQISFNGYISINVLPNLFEVFRTGQKDAHTRNKRHRL